MAAIIAAMMAKMHGNGGKDDGDGENIKRQIIIRITVQ
jgi:predicted chitinase